MTSRLHIAAGCAPDVCCSIIHGVVRGRVRARSVYRRQILRHLVCPFVGTRQRRSDVRIYLFSLTCVLATPACALDSSSLAAPAQIKTLMLMMSLRCVVGFGYTATLR